MEKKSEKLLREIDKEKGKKEPSLPDFWSQVYKYSLLGFLIITPLLGATLLGYYLTKRFSLPSFMPILFILGGLIFSVYNLWYSYGRKRKND